MKRNYIRIAIAAMCLAGAAIVLVVRRPGRSEAAPTVTKDVPAGVYTKVQRPPRTTPTSNLPSLGPEERAHVQQDINTRHDRDASQAAMRVYSQGVLDRARLLEAQRVTGTEVLP